MKRLIELNLRGDLSLAIERYTRSLELAPNNCESLYNRAIVQHGLKQNREALKDLNEALRLDPTFVLAMLARAALLWDAGERDTARSDLEHAKGAGCDRTDSCAVVRWRPRPTGPLTCR